MPIPVIVWLLGMGGTFILGALARQPEINRLKAQIEQLQKNQEALRKTILEQQRQIEELKIRFNALKAWQFQQRIEHSRKIRSVQLHRCALKEYMTLAVQRIRGRELTEEQSAFINVYGRVMDGQSADIAPEEFVVVRGYIQARYAYELSHGVVVDIDKEMNTMVSCND